MNFEKYEIIVKVLLETDKKCRCDDSYLFARVIEVLTGNALKQIYLLDGLKNKEKYGLPSYSTVMRTRQKLQQGNKELCEPNVKEIREHRRKAFREHYARSDNE